MTKALLLLCLLSPTAWAQNPAQQKQMLLIVESLLQGRAGVETQIDWIHLHIDNAPDLPLYSDLTAPQQAAFRKAVLTTLAARRGTTRGLRPRRAGMSYFLERAGLQYVFEGSPLRLTAIRFPK